MLLPVGEQHSNRTKSNPLYDEIRATNRVIDVLNGGNFYTLLNIRISPCTKDFVDVFILIDKVNSKHYMNLLIDPTKLKYWC